MTTQSRPPVKAEYGQAKTEDIQGRDIAGGYMGVPLFLLGLALYGIRSHLSLGVGMVLLLVSVGLIAPGDVYGGNRAIRASGFAMSVLTTALSAAFAV